MLTGEDELHAVLELLDGVEQRADGYMARCPCHDDRSPSLSLTVGNSGKLLVHCFAGCDSEDVLRELSRLQRSGNAMVKTIKVGAGEKVKTKNAPTKWCTLEQLVKGAWSSEHRAYSDHYYVYHNAKFKAVAVAFRWNATESCGREFRQARFNRDINLWQWGGPKELVLPFQYESVTTTKPKGSRPVLVVEGEKCAILAREKFHATAVTSMGGSGAAKKTDWGLLGGHDVVIWRDNDEAGMKYLDDVVELLLRLKEPPRSIKVIEPPSCLGDAEDVADWYALQLAEGRNDADIRTAFNELLSAAEPYRRDTEPTLWDEPPDVGTAFLEGRIDESTYEHNTNPPAVSLVNSDDIQPATIVPIHPDQKIGKSGKSGDRGTPVFPIDALGKFLGHWVRMHCESLQVTPGYLATPLLTAITGAIGDARVLQVTHKMRSFSSLFSLLVCESSSGKSRSLRAVREPLDKIDDELSAESGGGPKRKVVVESITDEMLIRILANNPGGLVGFYPEGNTFFTERKKYSGNREGHGCDLWLKIFDSDRIVYDRVGQQGDRPDLRVRRPVMSMFLAMTPGSAAPLLAPPYSDSGWTARLLMAQPDDIIADFPDDWDDDELPIEEREERRRIREELVRIDHAYDGLMRQLWELSPDIDSATGQRNPIEVRYCSKARKDYKAAWLSLGGLHSELKKAGHMPQSHTFARMKDNISRVALGLHCAAVAMGEHDGNPLEISEQTLNGALAIVDYYCDEALRAYAGEWNGSSSSSSPAGDGLDSDERIVLEWSLGRLEFKPYLQLGDFQKNHKERFPNVESVRIVVARLVAKGRLRWVKEYTRYGLPLDPDDPDTPIPPIFPTNEKSLPQ